MKITTLECPWIKDDFFFIPGKNVQISIVTYEHQMGLPARFCTGLIPAVALSKRLEFSSTKSVIRLIDPTPIANYCNGWVERDSQFKNIISQFLGAHSIDFFFDKAELVTQGTLDVLNEIGRELQSTTNKEIIEMVEKIKESGRRHGGESGASNAVLYMAAHPFSWLDMYHELIWKKKYSPDDYQFVNLMSKPESRFTLLREFLLDKKPSLSTNINSANHYMTVCNTPCYIPLESEPTFTDLTNLGYEWCRNRYYEIRNISGNHKRAMKDFELLISFLGLEKEKNPRIS